MRRPNRWRSTCSSSRGGPSGSISTSSRAPSTTISRRSRSCRPRSRPRRWRTRPGTSMTARRRPTRRPASTSACCSTSRAWRTPRQGRAVAVPAPLRAGRDAGERALSRPPAVGRGGLLPGLREGVEEVPAADGQGARRAAGSRRHLAQAAREESAEFIQNEVYEAGKRHFAQAELRQWFKTLYEVLLGSEQGPRMGAFIKLYGRDNVVRLIERALAGEDLGKAAVKEGGDGGRTQASVDARAPKRRGASRSPAKARQSTAHCRSLGLIRVNPMSRACRASPCAGRPRRGFVAALSARFRKIVSVLEQRLRAPATRRRRLRCRRSLAAHRVPASDRLALCACRLARSCRRP